MSLVIDRPFHLKPSPRRTGGYRIKAESGHEPPPREPATDRVHPLARRMALAIEAKRLIESGVVADAAEMARVAGVTRARMTQILNLTLLAPDIQAALIDLPCDQRLSDRNLRSVMKALDWQLQRRLWAGVRQ
jgi:hypothetical protein